MVSSTLIRAADEVARQALLNDLSYDTRLNVQARTEKEYFALQTSSGNVVRYLGTVVALIMAVGSCFAAMNTMYAAVARRLEGNRHTARAGLFARGHSVELPG